MFNIINHHMNANLNHNEVLSYTYQKGYHPKRTEVNVDEHVDTICTLLVGMSIGAATMDNSKEGPQNLNRELPNDPAIPLPGEYMGKKKKKHTNLDGLRQVLDACLSLRVSTACFPFPSSLIYSLPVTPSRSNLPVY